MRPLRHPLVLRALALVLLAGTCSALVPAASARDARTDALRSLLDDGEAFEAALQAAQTSDTDAAETFAAVYAEAAGHAVSAEAIRQLLGGQGVGAVALVLSDLAFVPTPTASTPPSVAAAGALTRAAQGAILSVSAATAPPVDRAGEGGAGHAVWARGP